MLRDPQLDAIQSLERSIQHKFRVVVQLIDDDVVARLQAEPRGYDVLAFGSREEEPDLVRGSCLNQASKLGAHLIAFPEERTELKGVL